ncbi:MAG: Ig-like domain-containing protein [Bacteroidales bacterium]|nr:Ig-like domain-containing protein [Bacteroidales bacterium]
MVASCTHLHRRDKVEISVSELHFGQQGGETPVKVTATSDWHVESTNTWIRSYITSDNNYVIIAPPNDSIFREDTLTFICGTASTTLHVTQEPSSHFSVSPANITFTYKGGTGIINVRSFSDWTIKKKSDWIETSPTNGTGPQSVTVKVIESEAIEPKSGNITFYSNGEEANVAVTVLAKPFIKMEMDTIKVSGDETDISILYLTNCNVYIDNCTSWIRTVNHDTISKRVSLEVLRNTAYTERMGKIRLVCKEDTSIYNTLHIVQGKKIDHPSLAFKEGDILEVSSNDTILLHPIFTDMTDTALVWSSSHPDIAKVDQDGKVAILNNGDVTVTAKNKQHQVKADILIRVKLIAKGMTIMLGNQDMVKNNTAVRYPGESIAINVILDPENSYMDDIVCISSNPKTVEIDGMLIKCLATGSSTITVESLYHNLRYSFRIIVIGK